MRSTSYLSFMVFMMRRDNEMDNVSVSCYVCSKLLYGRYNLKQTLYLKRRNLMHMHVQNFTIIWEYNGVQLTILMKYMVRVVLINCKFHCRSNWRLSKTNVKLNSELMVDILGFLWRTVGKSKIFSCWVFSSG